MSTARAVGVHHVGMTVASLDRALEFYVGGLDLEVLSLTQRLTAPYFRRLVGLPEANADIALLKAGRRSWIELVAYNIPLGPPAGVEVHRPGSTHLALRVNDIEGVCDRLAALGVVFRSRPQQKDYGGMRGMRFVYCRDPDGSLVELVQMPPDAPNQRTTAATEIHAKVVGREVRETRRALGLTRAEIADRLGVSTSYIAAVEAGRRTLTLGQLANIADAMRLGIDVSFIRPNGKSVVARGARSPTG